MDRVTAFLDSNVLYPATLRNFLMWLTLRGLFRAKWSDMVHEEWMAAVQRDFSDITREQLERTRDLMNLHAEDSLVTGFDELIEGLDLPDSNDRHVLAAAISCNADVIVTQNLIDFPSDKLEPYGIEAQHPDTFTTHLFDLSPSVYNTESDDLYSLGDLQQLALLAVVRLGKDAHGATIRQEIEEVAGRSVAIGTVYVTLVRLEKQGFVRSWRSDPESVRGGKAKRHFELTRKGALALKRVRDETDRMWDGLDPALESVVGKGVRAR